MRRGRDAAPTAVGHHDDRGGLAYGLDDGEGCLLAYVSVGDRMVNAELVRLGYAQVARLSSPGKYQELLLTRQREARDATRGLWAE